MLRALVQQLSEDYDLDPASMLTWVKSKKGFEQFITYLNDIGYKVSSYSWPSDDKDPLSWGFEFDDDNPLFIALRLKHGEDL